MTIESFHCSRCGTETTQDYSPFGEWHCESCHEDDLKAFSDDNETESFPCAKCDEETFFDYSCSGDLLCESCAIDQDTFDSGICPTCGAPMNDDSECFLCS